MCYICEKHIFYNILACPPGLFEERKLQSFMNIAIYMLNVNISHRDKFTSDLFAAKSDILKLILQYWSMLYF